MKRTTIFLLALGLVLSSCFSPKLDTVNNKTCFYLADTTGRVTTTFHSGESFIVKFRFTNTREDSLDFTMYDGGPFVRFSIYQGEQYIAGSMDGMGVYFPVFNRSLAPGDSIYGQWKAPTTITQEPKIILKAGTYRAIADFPVIEELRTDTIAAINFTILE